MQENATDKKKLVSSQQFYNSIIVVEFLLIDLREKNLYEKRHIDGAQNFPPSTSTFDDQQGCEREYRALIYTGARNGGGVSLTSNDQRISFFERQAKVTEIFILQNDFETFCLEFPFLCKNTSMNHIYPSLIIPGLYLSSAICSSDKQVLIDLNIKYILNATQETENHFEKEENICYKRLLLVDANEEDLLSHCEEARDFINQAKAQGSSVLVHCARGASRSPAIVASYLMFERGWTFDQTYTFLKQCRPYVNINHGFQQQLKYFENNK